MKAIFKYIRPYTGMLLLAVSLLFVQAICDLALPDYMSEIVNKGVLIGDTAFIWGTGGKMLLVTLLGAVSSISVGFFAAQIAAGVSHDMRFDVFNKVQEFSHAEIDKFGSSSLITRTTNDITQIQMLLVLAIRMVFYAPILGAGGVFNALTRSVSMTWVIALSIICILLCIIILFIIAMPKFNLVQKLVDRLNLVARENLDGMLVIRAFNTQEFEKNRFDIANKELTSVNLFVNRAMAVAMPVVMLIMNLTTVLIVWVGANQVSSFHMDVGDMMAFMQYAIQIIMAFMMLSMMLILIPRAAVSANRVQEILDSEINIKSPENPQRYKENFSPEIQFKNVDFAYPGGDGNVLHNIDFNAKKGQTTAIIGATGSGKSTLVNLIVRFYDVTGGQILIDGKDIRDVNIHDLREKIGYIPQKALLFSGTIKSNLEYGNKNGDIEKSARISQSTEFIENKPERYDSPIAQGGTNVSGGQKQRLSIARALNRNAPIYIFDDSFSALDLKTDSRLRAAIKAEIKDATLLIVAQRISTIMDAEQIIVLDNGRIAGRGTHKELLRSCSVYQEIARSQMSEEELFNE